MASRSSCRTLYCKLSILYTHTCTTINVPPYCPSFCQTHRTQVMTAPRRPEPPVIIRPQLRSIVVKWYPGAGGSYKYHLQARLVEGLDGIGAMAEANRTATASGGRRRAWGATGGDGESGWVTVYEGVDSTAKV